MLHQALLFKKQRIEKRKELPRLLQRKPDSAVGVGHAALARGEPVAQAVFVAAVSVFAFEVMQQGNKDHDAEGPFRQKAWPFAQSILL